MESDSAVAVGVRKKGSEMGNEEAVADGIIGRLSTKKGLRLAKVEATIVLAQLLPSFVSYTRINERGIGKWSHPSVSIRTLIIVYPHLPRYFRVIELGMQ